MTMLEMLRLMQEMERRNRERVQARVTDRPRPEALYPGNIPAENN